jgi:DNA-binding PadR family transcriptional regulator
VSSSSDRDSPADGLAPAAEPPAGLSELEVALLALLSIRPMTGYEILRHHARALEPWWETPRTQIYPKLRELQRRGVIEHEYVVQESKPTKRLYEGGQRRAGQRAAGRHPRRQLARVVNHFVLESVLRSGTVAATAGAVASLFSFQARSGPGTVATAVRHFPHSAVAICGPLAAVRELADGCSRYTW